MRKLLLVWGLFLLFASSIQAQNQEKAFIVGKVLDKAGSLRTLTQQIGKNYIAMYLNIDWQKSKKELDDCVLLFEKKVQELKLLKINARYSQLLKKLDEQWGGYKQIATSKPGKDNIMQMLSENTKILETCEATAEQIERYATRFSDENNINKLNNNIIHLENMATRQRMLSERVLLYFLARQAMIADSPIITEGLDNALKAYESALYELLSSPENTPEIDYRLAILSKQWEGIARSCSQKITDATQTVELLNLGTELLNGMDEITKLYEQLIDSKVATLMMNNAVKMAGEQSVMTQRIIKNYIILGLSPSNKANKAQLDADISHFEEHIDELKLFAPMPEITTALEVVDKLWTEFRNEAIATPSKTGAEKLLQNNNELLRACDNVVMLLEMYAKIYKSSVTRFNSNFAQQLSKITHQEMLAERISMYSNALVWGIGNEDIQKRMEQIGLEYLENLKTINENREASSELMARGEALHKKWENTKALFSDADKNKEALLKWSAELSEEVQLLTTLYKQQVNTMVKEEAIDKADHQSFLTQQIATAYIAIGMGLDIDNHKRQLEKDKLVFQRQLEELKTYVNSSLAKEAISEVNQLWNSYQVTFSSKVSKERVGKLLEQSDDILQACEKLAAAIELEISSQSIKKINKAAHLRTYTQEVLLNCLAYRWDKNQTNCKDKIVATLNKFQLTVKELRDDKDTSSDIKLLLEGIEIQRSRLSQLCNTLDEVDLYAILSLHNILLLETEKLTQAYEGLTFF